LTDSIPEVVFVQKTTSSKKPPEEPKESESLGKCDSCGKQIYTNFYRCPKCSKPLHGGSEIEGCGFWKTINKKPTRICGVCNYEENLQIK